MGDRSKIEWTDATWSPVVGCKAVSPGCDHCYAARYASRNLSDTYRGLAENGVFNGTVRCLPERLDQPLGWKRPRRILREPDVPNLSDCDVPDRVHRRDVRRDVLCFPQQTYEVLNEVIVTHGPVVEV